MSKRMDMVQECKNICEDDSHGYDQDNRWGPNYDCSSLMYTCAHDAGYDVPFGSGYTGTMLSDFVNAGFTAVAFDGNLSDLTPGDIMLNVENHTEMYVGDGHFGGAHIDENGNIAGGQSGDQTGHEVSICDAYIYSAGWDYVLVPPSEDGEDYHVTYNGTTVEEGELGEVSDGQELGVGSHWLNGFVMSVNQGSCWYKVHWLNGDWGEQTDGGNWVKGDNQFIDAIQGYYTSPNSDKQFKFESHVSPDSPGGHGDTWWEPQYDNNTDDGQDGYSGEPGCPIDLFKVSIVDV